VPQDTLALIHLSMFSLQTKILSDVDALTKALFVMTLGATKILEFAGNLDASTSRSLQAAVHATGHNWMDKTRCIGIEQT
jgi:hypothetical protein